jgi:hypothetical protein
VSGNVWPELITVETVKRSDCGGHSLRERDWAGNGRNRPRGAGSGGLFGDILAYSAAPAGKSTAVGQRSRIFPRPSNGDRRSQKLRLQLGLAKTVFLGALAAAGAAAARRSGRHHIKALEKDRARRYATPSEVAADIGRFLRDEPVLAPISVVYRARKYIRRHRTGVAVAAISAALLFTAGAPTR